MLVGKETSVNPPSSELQKKLERLLSFLESVQNTLPVTSHNFLWNVQALIKLEYFHF